MSRQVENVREQLFELSGNVFYGDISDLDANWRALADALIDVKMEPKVVFNPVKKKISALSQVVKDIGLGLGVDVRRLCELAERLEVLSSGGSSQSISEEMQEEVSDKMEIFSVEFEQFLDDYILPKAVE